METTHLGSGIWSYRVRTMGAIFFVTVPATIMRSAWRGEARNSMPQRSGRSQRDIEALIISIAQQASTNWSHHSDWRRPQLKRKSIEVTNTFLSKRSSIRPIRGHLSSTVSYTHLRAHETV